MVDDQASILETIGSESPSPEEFRKWANLNSFAARLNREGLIEGDMYALYELCAALEGENAAERITYRNISVATASKWIIRSGMQF
jgi:hypothetical protein